MLSLSQEDNLSIIINPKNKKTMKKYFYLCLIALGCMIGFTACDDDDDDVTLEDLENAESTDAKCTIKDNGTTLVLTVTAKYDGVSASSVTTATFNGKSDDAICIKAEEVDTYPNESIAKEMYEEAVEEDGAENVKLSGKKVIINLADELEGCTKAEVRAYMDLIKTYVDNGGNV